MQGLEEIQNYIAWLLLCLKCGDFLCLFVHLCLSVRIKLSACKSVRLGNRLKESLILFLFEGKGLPNTHVHVFFYVLNTYSLNIFHFLVSTNTMINYYSYSWENLSHLEIVLNGFTLGYFTEAFELRAGRKGKGLWCMLL